MRLEIRRPIGDQAITRRVTLIETVISEFFQRIPELLSDFLGRATDLDRALDKLWLDLFHQVNFLFTDCLTQGVSLSAGKATPLFGNLHKLLLIDQNAVGIL